MKKRKQPSQNKNRIRIEISLFHTLRTCPNSLVRWPVVCSVRLNRYTFDFFLLSTFLLLFLSFMFCCVLCCVLYSWFRVCLKGKQVRNQVVVLSHTRFLAHHFSSLFVHMRVNTLLTALYYTYCFIVTHSHATYLRYVVNGWNPYGNMVKHTHSARSHPLIMILSDKIARIGHKNGRLIIAVYFYIARRP